MYIDLIKQEVSLSVGELASFRQAPSGETMGYAPWRAALGQKWHKVAEAHTREHVPDSQFEYSFQATWQHRHWNFKIQGRVDQIIPTATGLLVREVKSIRQPVPCAEETLMEQYPNYFAQAAIYDRLFSVLPDFNESTHRTELYCIQIDTGAAQSIPIDRSTCQHLFDQQLDALSDFLDERRASRVRLNEIKIQPAFEELRFGQAELFEDLKVACLHSKITLLEAPTGFGKTGIVLEHALKQLKAGLYERCIYLTSKSTGQVETIRQVEQIAGRGLHYLQMRNRKEHSIQSNTHSCTGDSQCAQDLLENWRKADLHAPDLLKKGTLTIETAKQIGADAGICPYEISKACLAHTEVWIGDLNYVFAPQSQSVFKEVFAYDPSRTLLIVDEAHNLPERTASALTEQLVASELIFALEELKTAGAPRKLISTGQELIRFIEKLKAEAVLSSQDAYEALDLCEDFANQLQGAHFDYEALPNFAYDTIWKIPLLAQNLAGPAYNWLHWTPETGILRTTCLDASSTIREALEPFSACILMSATLNPIQSYQQSIGLRSEDYSLVEAAAPWRDDAYTVAIDLRVDTRLRLRSQYYEATARTVAALAYGCPGEPIVVFFASYQYAENIQAYLETIHPEYRIAVQERGLDLAEQEAFIRTALLSTDVLFLILGSSYAEGVDTLGGKVSTIMIVGPALPEVNAVQKAKMEAHPSSDRDSAFKEVYILPAMRRIHQAMGRIVRAPGHRAKVLLHDRRFAEATYFEALAPEYQSSKRIQSDAQLQEWIEYKEKALHE